MLGDTPIDFCRTRKVYPTHHVVFREACLKTSKFRGCYMAFFGEHMTRSTSMTQVVISLNTGESEFQAAVKSTSIGIVFASMARHMRSICAIRWRSR